MSLNKPLQILLASGSNFFLDGIERILEDRCKLKVVAKASNWEEIEEYLTEAKPEFLFLDNRYIQIELNGLLNLITKKSPSTRVILLASRKEGKLDFSNVVYVTKRTDSSGLRRIVETRKFNRWALTRRSHRKSLER